MANTRPSRTKAQRQQAVQAQVVATAQVKAASDAAAIPDEINSSLISVDLTTVNPILQQKLQAIEDRLDSIDPPA